MGSTKNVKSKKLALIYGVLLGDGCLSKVGKKHYFIHVCGSIKDDYRFFKKVVAPILEHFTNKKIRIKKRIKQRMLQILFSDKKLFKFLNNIGFPVGKKGTQLKIPKYFDTKYLKYIIQGYFATDGSLVITNNNGIAYPRIEFSSISKPLLLQVLNHLRNIGMNGNCYISKIYTNKRYCTSYRIQFNGKDNLEKFIEMIGFVNPKHPEKYKKWKNNAAGGIRNHDLSVQQDFS